jgi:hypothetical protein
MNFPPVPEGASRGAVMISVSTGAGTMVCTALNPLSVEVYGSSAVSPFDAGLPWAVG